MINSLTIPASDTQPLLMLLCCWSRSSSEVTEPTLHMVDHPADRCPVCSSRGHLPLPAVSAVSNHQRQGTGAAPKTLFDRFFRGHVTLKPSPVYRSLPGDVQSQTNQGHASTAAATHAHTPHQLPPLGLRLLPRPGLR